MKWKTINLFISSTFNDMHAERDYIRKILIPRLNASLSHYKVSVQATDLRWGISTTGISEEERDSKVLHVCLNTIHNTRPYFLALLGERYGWMPTKKRILNFVNSIDKDQKEILAQINEETSVTEIEILMGALGTPDMLSHSFFCFRDNHCYTSLPPHLKSIYMDSPESKEYKKLQSLKKHIIENCECVGESHRIVEYSPTWNKYNNQFEDLERFGDSLFDLLKEDIIANIEHSTDKPINNLIDSEDEALSNFIELNSMNFIGRDDLLTDILDFIQSKRSSHGAMSDINGRFLVGASGCGKSYVFSALCSKLANLPFSENLVLLSHAAGLTQESTNTRNMIHKWVRQMLRVLGEDAPVNKSDIESQFKSLIIRLQGTGFFPVIVIDSLDSFISDPDHLLKKWTFVPYSVPVICTTLPGYADAVVFANPRYELVNIDSFSKEDAVALINFRLSSNVKELTKHQIDTLLNKKKADGIPAYSSPLWLQLAISVLLELGSQDFREIHNMNIDGDDCKIEAFIQNIIEELPSEPETLFAHFITITTRYFDKELTVRSLLSICLTVDGIDNEAMAYLCDDSWDTLQFLSIQYWMRDFIRRDPTTGRWKFTHNILKEIIRKGNDELVDDMTHKLVSFWGEKVKENELLLDSYIYLLVSGGHIDGLYEFMNDQNNNYDCAQSIAGLREELDSHRLVEFVSLFMRKYHRWEYAIEFMEAMAAKLIDKELDSPEIENHDFLVEIARTLAQSFSHQEIYCGNAEVLAEFFEASAIVFEVYENFQLNELAEDELSQLKAIYFENKSLHGNKILHKNLLSSFYSIWRRGLYQLFKKVKYSDNKAVFVNELDCFFDEIEWFISNSAPQANFVTKIAMIRNVYADKFHEVLTMEQQDSFDHRIQNIFLQLYSDTYTDYAMQTYISSATKLVEEYMDAHKCEYSAKVIPFSTTPLMEFLSIPGYDERSKSMEEEAQLRLDAIQTQYEKEMENDEEGQISILQIDDDDFWADLEDEIDIDQFFNNDLDEVSEKEVQEEMDEATLSTKVREQYKAIDRLLAENDFSDIHSDAYDDLIIQYRDLTFDLTKNLIALNDRDSAITLLNNLEVVISRSIAEIEDNYVFPEISARLIISLCDLYEEIDEHEKAKALYENAVGSLWHSYYHHVNGEGQIALLDALAFFYNHHGLILELLNFQEIRFKIASIYYHEHRFDPYDLAFRDLSYFSTAHESLRMAYLVSGYYDKEAALEIFWDNVRKECSLIDSTASETNKETFIKEFDSVAPFGNNHITPMSKNGMYGYIDKQGMEIVPPTYSLARPFSCLRAAVAKEVGTFKNEWGFIDENGNEIVKPQYADVGDFREGLAWVCISRTGKGLGYRGNKYGYIHPNGIFAIPPIYDDASSFVDGKALVFIRDRFFYIDMNGNEINVDSIF